MCLFYTFFEQQGFCMDFLTEVFDHLLDVLNLEKVSIARFFSFTLFLFEFIHIKHLSACLLFLCK